MKLETVTDARETCSFCPKLCRQACPVAEVERTEVATPTFKQQVALLAASGEQPLDAERARALYKCSDCAATVDACRHRISVGDSLREARVGAVRAGVAPESVGWLAQRMREQGSPYSADLRAKLEAVLPGKVAEGGSLGLFPSCTALAHHPDEVRDASQVLETAGVPLPVALSDPVCCGYPLDAAGHAEAFADHAQRVARSLSGFQRLVTPGAACAHTLAVRYREVGANPTFSAAPLVDLLAEHTARWRSLAGSASSERRYAYADPCFLGRRLGRYEQPRAVLRAALGREVDELQPTRSASLCSGGGGVYPLTHPEQAKGCAGRVAQQFMASGANVLVTGCPSARRRIAQAAPDVEVQSLVGVLAERLRG